ncbi:hypothetical protein BCR39DRAFT_542971 [Naematelia encephala]|uniref:Carboxymethylenebutenolidase n=1 Tax=Naematelia encephala TaxID=71784 RepID=A0A1Y2AV88_9TREE|nr:hypothetical protein BCR39DRAFT_542971 [Naematelia encephala]
MSTTSFEGPMYYDAASENEREVPLPSAPRIPLAPNVLIQPPLTRRGYGPPLVLLVPNIPGPPPIGDATPTTEQIDPEPIQKWAEEGFAILAIFASKGESGEWSFAKALAEGLPKLKAWDDVDDYEVVKDKASLIVYDHSILPDDFFTSTLPVHVLVIYGPESLNSVKPHPTIPTLLNTCTPSPMVSSLAVPRQHKFYSYENQADHFFCFPGGPGYDHHHADISHARSLSWIKKKMNGPWFDLEAIWEEHTAHEFFTRSVAKTMGTMVAQPYVNHIPTITGGVGRRDLTAFYRDHFIFSNPRDTVQTMVSRCVGIDRVAEEFTFSFTHDQVVDWLLPGVPPTGRKITVPMNAFVSIRGDRLYHEHISWDQAIAYRQIGLLPTHVAFQNGDMPEPRQLRLPTSDGTDAAKMLVTVGAVKSNQMFDWGLED